MSYRDNYHALQSLYEDTQKRLIKEERKNTELLETIDRMKNGEPDPEQVTRESIAKSMGSLAAWLFKFVWEHKPVIAVVMIVSLVGLCTKVSIDKISDMRSMVNDHAYEVRGDDVAGRSCTDLGASVATCTVHFHEADPLIVTCYRSGNCHSAEFSDQ